MCGMCAYYAVRLERKLCYNPPVLRRCCRGVNVIILYQLTQRFTALRFPVEKMPTKIDILFEKKLTKQKFSKDFQ